MTVAVEVQVDTRQVAALVQRFGKDAAIPGILDAIGLRILNFIDENFRAGGAENPWKALSPNTIASRRKGKGAGSAQPLRDTGRLAQSFVARNDIGAASVWVGTETEYAEYHHFGTGPYKITTNPPDRRARMRGVKRTSIGGEEVSFFARGKAAARRAAPKRRPGALRFMTPAGPVYRREVKHPGIPSRPLLPSLALADRLAKAVVDKIVEEAVAG